MSCDFMLYLIILRLIVITILVTGEDLLCTRHYVVHFYILYVIFLTILQDWLYYPFYTVKKTEAYKTLICGTNAIRNCRFL